MSRKKGIGSKKGQRTTVIIAAGTVAMVVVLILVVALLKGTALSNPALSADIAQKEQAETDQGPQSLPSSSGGQEETFSTETSSEEETDKGEEISGKDKVAGNEADGEDPQALPGMGAQGGAEVEVSRLQPAPGETETSTVGIDVSKYQGNIDWARVKATGIDFAMVRVGYRTKVSGVITEDPAARYNLQEATKNGIKVGVYFFSSAASREEAQEEAAWVTALIAPYKITYPVAYNCEDYQSEDSRQHQLTREERTQIACAFLDVVAQNGYTPMFYASRNEMEGSAQWDMGTLGKKYRIWVSQYPEQPYPQTPSSDYSGDHVMWQYTSQGQVDGIKTKVDINVAYFGYSQEASAKDPTPVQEVMADPELGINFTPTEDMVTAKNETNLRNLPSTEESVVVHVLKNGEVLQRTGIGSNGWDRLLYEGQKVYAVHSYLTTETAKAPQELPEEKEAAGSQVVEGLVFTAVSEAVTARDKVNLRDKPSTQNGNIVGSLNYGEVVLRTGLSGTSDTGWSRLEINGQVVYASSRLLATSMDYREQEKPTLQNPEAGFHFVPATGTVKAKSGETNLRTLPTTDEPSTVVAQLIGDATLQRVAVDKDRGWTKLEYNGQSVYAVSSYLTVVE